MKTIGVVILAILCGAAAVALLGCAPTNVASRWTSSGDTHNAISYLDGYACGYKADWCDDARTHVSPSHQLYDAAFIDGMNDGLIAHYAETVMPQPSSSNSDVYDSGYASGFNCVAEKVYTRKLVSECMRTLRALDDGLYRDGFHNGFVDAVNY